MEKGIENEPFTFRVKRDVEIFDSFNNPVNYKKDDLIEGAVTQIKTTTGTTMNIACLNINGNDTLFDLDKCKKFVEIVVCQ